MAYLRVWIHIVWSTKNRNAFMSLPDTRHRIFNHIFENARTKDINLDCMNGWIDHAHAFISLGPDQTIAKIA
jgi:putative transposase